LSRAVPQGHLRHRCGPTTIVVITTTGDRAQDAAIELLDRAAVGPRSRSWVRAYRAAAEPKVSLPEPARLKPPDVVALGAHGMRTRPVRAVLPHWASRSGVAAIGRGAGDPASGAQALHDRLAALGTNCSRRTGQTLFGTTRPAGRRVSWRSGSGRYAATGTGTTSASVRRSDKIQ